MALLEKMAFELALNGFSSRMVLRLLEPHIVWGGWKIH